MSRKIIHHASPSHYPTCRSTFRSFNAADNWQATGRTDGTTERDDTAARSQDRHTLKVNNHSSLCHCSNLISLSVPASHANGTESVQCVGRRWAATFPEETIARKEEGSVEILLIWISAKLGSHPRPLRWIHSWAALRPLGAPGCAPQKDVGPLDSAEAGETLWCV